jgi:DNA-binding transcriptional LysR family regulator
MHDAHLSAVDLNLLPLLDALLDERHVTRAGRRVGLSQPAASRGLGRLRALLGDPLLVGDVLAPPAPFEPARLVRTVRIACDDYGALVVLAPGIPRLTGAAPGLDVRVVPRGAGPLDMLVRGDVDLAITPLNTAARRGGDVLGAPLLDERFVCLVGRRHPFARRRPTLRQFAAARHALITPLGRPGSFVDDALATRGLERRVVATLPHFLAMPFLIAESDLVVTIAERIARTVGARLPVATFEPPLPVPGFTLGVYWHSRDGGDPALTWIREQLALACAPRGGGAGTRR